MQRRLLVVLSISASVLAAFAVLAFAAGKHSTKHHRRTHPRSTFLLGERTVEPSGDTEPSNRSEAFRFRSAASGTARSIALYVDAANAASTVRVAIYADTRGHPGSLLRSGSKSRPVARAWNYVGLTPTRIHRGRTYWIAVLGLGGALAYRDARSGPCPSEESAQTNLTGFPTRWRGGPRWRSCPISAVVISAGLPKHAATPLPPPPVKPPPPPVKPPPPPVKPPPPPPVSGGKNCITHPSACGYPDQTNTGVPAGTRLTSRSGDIKVTSPGQTISGLSLDGSIEVTANNTTIKNSEIVVNGTQAGCNSPCGGHGIWVGPNVKGTIIQDVTCHGGAPTGANVTEFCVQSNDSSTQVKRVHYYNCTTCMVGPGSWSDSFVDQTGATIPQEHYEDIYFGGGDPSLVVNHNTMLNPQDQTAVVFVKNDFGDINTVTITNNLMAGGGYMIYGGLGGNGAVNGPVTVTGNRFSRLYFPKGGFFGINAAFNDAVTNWSGNIWDDTLAPVPF